MHVSDNGVSPVDEIFSKFMVDLLALFSFVLVVCVCVCLCAVVDACE